jgi:ATP-dependent DNA ligase
LGRCEYGKVVLYSRSGIPFDLPHITNQLSKILPNGAVVDGELYLHSVGFQTLGSWIKKAQPESANIEYHLYDMPSTGENKEGKPWVERKADLANLFAQNTFDKIYMVPSHPVANEKEVTEWHNEMTIEGGFEGAIVRLLDGVYNYGYRSYDLLKVKQFDDDEYPIVGYTNGKGKFTNCPIFSCRTKEGKTFDVVPKGTFEYRAQLLAEGDKYIGKHMTVIYFGKSDDGIPRFPVGKGFRLEEDR